MAYHYAPTTGKDKPADLLLTAFILFLIAGLSDIVDGHIARKYNATSKFGRTVYPLADKFWVCGAFICFAIVGQPRFDHFNFSAMTLHIIQWATAIIILVREVFVQTLRHVAEARGVNFAAVSSGKIKMFLQSFGIGTVLIKWAYVTREWGDWFTMIIFILLVAAAHLAELDDQGWQRLTEDARESHRGDIHQVLAYASLYSADEISASLIYPLRRSTFETVDGATQPVVERPVIESPVEAAGPEISASSSAVIEAPELSRRGPLSEVVAAIDRLPPDAPVVIRVEHEADAVMWRVLLGDTDPRQTATYYRTMATGLPRSTDPAGWLAERVRRAAAGEALSPDAPHLEAANYPPPSLVAAAATCNAGGGRSAATAARSLSVTPSAFA